MKSEFPASHSIIVTPDRMISPTGSWANESQVNMTSTTTPSSSTAAPSIQRMTSQQTNLFPNVSRFDAKFILELHIADVRMLTFPVCVCFKWLIIYFLLLGAH